MRKDTIRGTPLGDLLAAGGQTGASARENSADSQHGGEQPGRRRSFFYRTSSSAYSLQQDAEEATNWCHYDNTLYDGDAGIPQLQRDALR